jgi:hypothetical protein
MRGLSIRAFAVAVIGMMLSVTPNALAQQEKPPVKQLTHIGFLSCDVASGWGTRRGRR